MYIHIWIFGFITCLIINFSCHLRPNWMIYVPSNGLLAINENCNICKCHVYFCLHNTIKYNNKIINKMDDLSVFNMLPKNSKND